MKKFVLTVLFGMIALTGFSQLRWNVQGGMNFGNLTHDDNADALIGFNAGVGLDYAFTDRWSLKSGVMFTSKGYKHGEFKARPIYLEFPVMGAIKMPITERVKFVVNAGVYFAAGLVGQYDTSDVVNLADGLSSSGAYKTLIFDDVTGIFRRFDVGVQYGVGVELADHYLIHLTGQNGFITPYDDGYYPEEYEGTKSKNVTFTIGVGYIF